MRYEVPFIIEIEADDRVEADNEADDLADCIADVFVERIRAATAITTPDHNILERLGIKYEGVE